MKLVRVLGRKEKVSKGLKEAREDGEVNGEIGKGKEGKGKGG